VQVGDVILAFNNQPLKSVDQLRRLVDRSRGSIALLIQREGNKIYVPIRLAEQIRPDKAAPRARFFFVCRGLRCC